LFDDARDLFDEAKPMGRANSQNWLLRRLAACRRPRPGSRPAPSNGHSKIARHMKGFLEELTRNKALDSAGNGLPWNAGSLFAGIIKSAHHYSAQNMRSWPKRFGLPVSYPLRAMWLFDT